MISIISKPLSLSQTCEVFEHFLREVKSVALRKSRPLSINSPLEGSGISSSSSSDAEDSIYLEIRIELVVFFVRFAGFLATLRRWEVAHFMLAAIVEGRKERVTGVCGVRDEVPVGVLGTRREAGGDSESGIMVVMIC